MATETELQQISRDGKLAFEAGNYESAAGLFEKAAAGYLSLKDEVNAAELKNNSSVALLKWGKAQEALDATAGTEQIFAGAHDLKRQAMAAGNQAAALEALNQFDQALAA